MIPGLSAGAGPLPFRIRCPIRLSLLAFVITGTEVHLPKPGTVIGRFGTIAPLWPVIWPKIDPKIVHTRTDGVESARRTGALEEQAP
jgi:hypothetical protein